MKRLWFLGLLFAYPLFAAGVPSQEVLSEMIQTALEGQKKAYAPYSNYFVGSALLTKSGSIYSGSNIENASYGLCNCSERTAAFKAISEGDLEFEAIVVATRDGGMPCGACRQVLNEFNPSMAVITVNESGEVQGTFSLDQLLPYAFGPANVQ